MGLALDEFALWLDLKDVYWSEQGRKSIDAVIIAATITGMVLVGFTAWVDVATEVEDAVFAIVGAFGLIGDRCSRWSTCEGEVRDGRRRVPDPAGRDRGGVPARAIRTRSGRRIFYSEEKKARADARFHGHRPRPGSPPKQEPASGQSGAGSG